MIRVVVVDDSAVVRRILRDALERHADIEVVGTAADPYAARDQIVRLRPDVVTLDVEMPRMDGLSFLAKLMRHYPVPTVVVSSLAPRDSDTAVRALALGAVEVVPKPRAGVAAAAIGDELARAVRAAAAANVARRAELDLTATCPPTAPAASDPSPAAAHTVLAIGASTGGTRAIERVLCALPATAPATLIVQHMPAPFTAAFAQRLDAVCAMEVREARDGDTLAPGLALVAPGDRHLVLHRSGAGLVVRIKNGPPVHHQRPAVDVLFESVARHAGADAIGVLLTGMGADGAKGLLAIRAAGAHTIAQDEASCVVFGMPKEAARLGAAVEILDLVDIPGAILKGSARGRRVAAAVSR